MADQEVAVKAEVSPSKEAVDQGPADPQQVRALKIKTGVAKRYAREKECYEEEIVIQKARIEKFKLEGKDEFFMKQQTHCLCESQAMIPDCYKRFVTAYEELKQLVDAVQNGESIAKTDEYKAAVAVLESTKSQLVWE